MLSLGFTTYPSVKLIHNIIPFKVNYTLIPILVCTTLILGKSDFCAIISTEVYCAYTQSRRFSTITFKERPGKSFLSTCCFISLTLSLRDFKRFLSTEAVGECSLRFLEESWALLPVDRVRKVPCVPVVGWLLLGLAEPELPPLGLVGCVLTCFVSFVGCFPPAGGSVGLPSSFPLSSVANEK